MNNQIIIPHLGILVTSYCNLNCRHCADLIPKRANCHYALTDIINDFQIILEAVHFIDEVLVIGGETLMYPQLEPLLAYLQKIDKIGKIIITTNGSIMPSEALLQALKSADVTIRISGYPEFVTPNRTEILTCYNNAQLTIENLENINWADIGDTKFRSRSNEALAKVFATCTMKECVALSEGLLFYCSRQMAAAETDIYPAPFANEIVDVRSASDLQKSIEAFYNLPFISTCNYCDGISCATKNSVPTAIQMLEKTEYLNLLEIYAFLSQTNTTVYERIPYLQQLAAILQNHDTCFYGIDSYNILIPALLDYTDTSSDNHYSLLITALCSFINELSMDYTFHPSDRIPYRRTPLGNEKRNTIFVDMAGDSPADILLSSEDLEEAADNTYPIDNITYNRLFVESKLELLKQQPIKCIISGLSYTQYGILEKELPCAAVNLSVTSNDIPYSLLLAEKALELNPSLNYIVVPIAYYQGFYDMSDDDSDLHKAVVSRIDIPLLGKARGYHGEAGPYIKNNSADYIQIYDKICDLEQLARDRDKKIKAAVQHAEYFNEINPMPAYGGLKFDFYALSEPEKQESAKITASLNERACTPNGYKETIAYLKSFLTNPEVQKHNIIFFVPPMTKYLYDAYHPELKKAFYDKIVPILTQHKNVIFYDLADCNDFVTEDFSDFEHLNGSGAVKLTGKVGKWIQKIKE